MHVYTNTKGIGNLRLNFLSCLKVAELTNFPISVAHYMHKYFKLVGTVVDKGRKNKQTTRIACIIISISLAQLRGYRHYHNQKVQKLPNSTKVPGVILIDVCI